MIVTIRQAPRMPAGPGEGALGLPWGPPDEPRAVGPLVILAHSLRIDALPGALAVDADVRPHPHIGLAAITYLLEGTVTHRDSLGSRVEVEAGGVSLTIAGRGIVHSERFERLRVLGGRLELLQLLFALPEGHEEIDPSFAYVPPSDVPTTRESGCTTRWLLGAPHGQQPRAGMPGPVLLHDVELAVGGRYVLPEGFDERAIYLLSGSVRVDGQDVPSLHTVVFDGEPATVETSTGARLLAVGGEPLGPRYMWWNYIHSSLASIEAAKAQWRAGELDLPEGDTESFTPAPPDDGRPLRRING